MASPARDALTQFLTGPARGAYRLLGGFRVEGAENVPTKGGCIIAPNHLSWADPPAIRLAVKRRLWFMANDFLFQIPVLGSFIRYFNAFPVKRGVLDRDAIRKAEEHLQNGDLLCVFPEGGTTITGRLVPFEGGVALLALRNNVPIVPAGLGGTDRVLPREVTLPRWAKGGVTIKFGKPIYPSEIDPALPRRERMDALTERLYWAVNDLIPPEYRPNAEDPKGVVKASRESPPTPKPALASAE